MSWAGATSVTNRRTLPVIASRSTSTLARGVRSCSPPRAPGAGAIGQQLAERGGEVVGDVAGGDGDPAEVAGGQRAGAAVDPGAEAGGVERLQALGKQRAGQAGEHVAGAAGGERRDAGGVHGQPGDRKSV